MHYPRHIGIIPDGNRTRAQERELPSIFWHKAGFEHSKKLVEYCFLQTEVECITLRWASTENIQERSPQELEYLYDIYQTIDDDMKEFYLEHGIGYKRIWSSEWLPDKLVDFFHQQEKKFISKNGKYIILAVNYGGNDEIIRGINSLLQNNPNLQSVSEQQLSDTMDLWSFPAVDLVIRTKGEMAKRLSGFMTRWISYAELYFSDKFFPDFSIEELQKALERYDSIVKYRNFWK